MSRHGGDLVVEMLVDLGVTAVFGLVGGQTLPLHDGIRSRGHAIRHVAMRDECNAAYAADGYARISRRVGVCDATVGPGAIKFASGLAEALNSSVPLVAIVGDMQSDWVGPRYRGGGNQLVDQLAVLRPLCKWAARLPSTEKLPELLERGFQFATSGRPGPVVLELAEDLLRAPFDGSADPDPLLRSVPTHRPTPDPGAVRRAAELLAESTQPVMLAGGGVWLSDARAEAALVAERYSIPVATSLSGKGAIAEDHPLSLGVVGALGGTDSAHDYVSGSDVVLAIGFKFAQNPTYRWTLPKRGQRIIHLDIDPAEIGKVAPTEVPLVGDARAGFEALLATGLSRHDPDVRPRLADMRRRWQTWLQDEATEAVPLKPQQVAAVLNRAMSGDDAVLVSDASFASGWAGMYFDVTGNRRALFPRGMSGLGWGLPAAIGVQIARPGAQVVALVGDGALAYCVGELATLVQEELPIVVVVLNNGALGWTKWEQALYWDGKFLSTDIPMIDFAAVAKGFGCAGATVSTPSLLEETIREALTMPGPFLVDVRTTAAESAARKFLDSESARKHMQDAS